MIPLVRQVSILAVLGAYSSQILAQSASSSTSAPAEVKPLPLSSARQGRVRFEQSLGLWLSTQWTKEAANAEVNPFSLYRGQWSLDRSNEQKSVRQTGGWSLGLGEEGQRFVQATSQNTWSSSIAAHQLTLEADASAGLFRDTLAFIPLENQYILDREGNPELVRRAIERQESSLRLGLTDTLRVTNSVELSFSGDLRLSRSRLGDTRDDKLQLTSTGLGLKKTFARLSWSAAWEESRLRLESLLPSVPNLPPEVFSSLRQQILQSAETRVEALILPRWYLGLGYLAYQSRFTAAPKQTIDGPSFSLRYSGEGTWTWQGEVSQLRNRQARETEAQVFSSMTLGYNPGRSHRWELTTRRELNQLSSYQSLALDPFLPNDAQRYAIDSQASWTWQMNRWSSTLSANRSEQIYRQQLARTDRLAHSLSYQSSRTSRITQELSYSQTLNRQAGLTLARRSIAQLRSAYQQSWGGGALAWSRRPFVSAEITGETLDDALTQIPYRRLTLLLAIGEN